MLQGKQQTIACAILRCRHPRPVSLALPAIADEVLKPFQAKDSRPTVIVLSADGQYAGKRHTVEGRTLWIADGSITDRANQGTAEQLNPTYRPAMHQIVTDNRQIKAGNKSLETKTTVEARRHRSILPSMDLLLRSRNSCIYR